MNRAHRQIPNTQMLKAKMIMNMKVKMMRSILTIVIANTMKKILKKEKNFKQNTCKNHYPLFASLSHSLSIYMEIK